MSIHHPKDPEKGFTSATPKDGSPVERDNPSNGEFNLGTERIGVSAESQNQTYEIFDKKGHLTYWTFARLCEGTIGDEETLKLVEAHLEQCGPCHGFFECMKLPDDISDEELIRQITEIREQERQQQELKDRFKSPSNIPFVVAGNPDKLH